MKTSHAALCVGAFITALLLYAPKAEAIIACRFGTDSLALTPTGTVTYDTIAIPRSMGMGFFVIDGGPSFDVNTTFARVPPAPAAVDETCVVTSSTVIIEAVDPWAGVDGGTLTFQVDLP